MSATSKVAVAVATGYLLGRTRKLKLAIAAGSLLAGKRLGADPASLLKQGAKFIDSNPELKAAQDQLRGRLLESAKGAAITVAASRLEHLNQSLLESGDRRPGADDPEDQETEEDTTEDDDVRTDEGARRGRTGTKKRARSTSASRAKKGSSRPAEKAAKKSPNTRKAELSRSAAKKTSSARRSRGGSAR